jgi:Chaperone of endosialidase
VVSSLPPVSSSDPHSESSCDSSDDLEKDATSPGLGAQDLAAVALDGQYESLRGLPQFARVAFTGDYDDLQNRPPSIQEALQDYATLKEDLAPIAFSGAWSDLSGPYLPQQGGMDLGELGNPFSTIYAADVVATGDVLALSDARTKTDVKQITSALRSVCQLRGVTYRSLLDDSGRVSMGLVAQEVEAVLPELVHTCADGTKTLAYSKMMGVVVEAIKELATRIVEN